MSFFLARLAVARALARPLGRRDRIIKEDFHSTGAGTGSSSSHSASLCASFLFRSLFSVRASLPAGRKTCSPLNNHPYPPTIGSRFRILKNEERKMSSFVPHFLVFRLVLIFRSIRSFRTNRSYREERYIYVFLFFATFFSL